MDPDSAERLRRVVARLARYLNAEATAEGLTPSQASVLAIVVGHEPIGIAEILEFEGLNPTMLSRVLGKLEGRALITRAAAAEDQRVVTVAATDQGRALHHRLKGDRAAAVGRLVDQLPPALQGRLEECLPALEGLAEASAMAATSVRP